MRKLTAAQRGELTLAALILTWAVPTLSVLASHPDQGWQALAFAVPYAVLVALWRRWPVAAAAVMCATFVAVRPLGLAPAFNGPLGVPFLWMLFLLAYTLGARTGLGAGLSATVLLLVCGTVANGSFDSIGLMITVGPWLAGRVILSRRRMAEQLQARNDELRAERELFALESVRYERARIARDLHDIVAHCLSVMVVQASAGQRLAGTDRAGMTRALESVAEAAAQAQTEIGRLVELLGGKPPSGAAPRLEMIDELLARARLSGTIVSCRFLGPCDRLNPAASEAAFRLVQEALTNTLKHAPGAPVEITVRGHDACVQLDIVNAAPPGDPSRLGRSGGGYGLAGMRDRVTACGGSLSCGPTTPGGWRVSALLPADAQVLSLAEENP